MCGIVGLYNFRNISRDKQHEVVKAATDCMERRGPDDSGINANEVITFGHRRLAIIDPKGATQPWVDGETGCVLTYNGEIYNFQQLRKELTLSGHQFQTNSDTEVVIRSYIEWGRGCVNHFSGIFAFAIYDPRNESLLLARDRVGVKPLFYTCKDGGVAFASTVAAMLHLPMVERVMDLAAVSHYLTTIRTTLGSHSMIKGVNVLQAGEYLTIEKDCAPSVFKYWDYPVIPADEKEPVDFEEATERVTELMQESVEEQLISDVPLGGFLSGGIDSCIIAKLAGQQTDGKFAAYNVGYDEEGFNEWPYVKMASEYYDMKCNIISLESDSYPDVWRFLIKEKGLPLSTPNEVPIFHLADNLKKDFTVALSGEGADEIFGGYTKSCYAAYDFERSRRVAPAEGEALSKVDQALTRMYGRSFLLGRLDHFFNLNSWVSMGQKNCLLHGDILTHLKDDEKMIEHYAGMFEEFSQCTTFDSYLQVHARVNLEGLLFRVDSSSMAASVETRVPFTDHRLIEYAFNLPDEYKMDWKNAAARAEGANLNINEIDNKQLIESKRLIRHGFGNCVPQPILDRPKMSFPTPFIKSLDNEWLEMGRELLSNSPLRGVLFSEAAVQEMNEARGEQAGFLKWPLINLCIWQQEWNLSVS